MKQWFSDVLGSDLTCHHGDWLQNMICALASAPGFCLSITLLVLISVQLQALWKTTRKFIKNITKMFLCSLISVLTGYHGN